MNSQMTATNVHTGNQRIVTQKVATQSDYDSDGDAIMPSPTLSPRSAFKFNRKTIKRRRGAAGPQIRKNAPHDRPSKTQRRDVTYANSTSSQPPVLTLGPASNPPQNRRMPSPFSAPNHSSSTQQHQPQFLHTAAVGQPAVHHQSSSSSQSMAKPTIITPSQQSSSSSQNNVFQFSETASSSTASSSTASSSTASSSTAFAGPSVVQFVFQHNNPPAAPQSSAQMDKHENGPPSELVRTSSPTASPTTSPTETPTASHTISPTSSSLDSAVPPKKRHRPTLEAPAVPPKKRLDTGRTRDAHEGAAVTQPKITSFFQARPRVIHAADSSVPEDKIGSDKDNDAAGEEDIVDRREEDVFDALEFVVDLEESVVDAPESVFDRREEDVVVDGRESVVDAEEDVVDEFENDENRSQHHRVHNDVPPGKQEASEKEEVKTEEQLQTVVPNGKQEAAITNNTNENSIARQIQIARDIRRSAHRRMMNNTLEDVDACTDSPVAINATTNDNPHEPSSSSTHDAQIVNGNNRSTARRMAIWRSWHEEFNQFLIDEDDKKLVIGDCVICSEEKVECFGRMACDHKFCCNCLKNWIKAKVESKDTNDIKCPLSQQNQPCSISSENILRLVAGDQNLRNLYLENQWQIYIRTERDLIHCPQPDCEGSEFVTEEQKRTMETRNAPEPAARGGPCERIRTFLERITRVYIFKEESEEKGEENDGRTDIRKFKCPSCDFQMCCLCKTVWAKGQADHTDKSCESYADDVRRRSAQDAANLQTERYIAENSRPCPSCSIATQRNGGCRHMTCTQCRHEWWWCCSMPYVSDWTEHQRRCGQTLF